MSIITRRLTYDDLAQMPDDRNRYEIIDGELVVTAAPVPQHEDASFTLAKEFDAASARAGRMGKVYTAPVDVKLSEHDIVEPDVVFIRRERRHIVGRKYIEGAPDILVEVLSPSSRVYDEVHKARLYAAAGVPEYWIVDVDARTVRVFHLVEGSYQLLPNDGHIARSLVIPDLAVDISTLFEDIW